MIGVVNEEKLLPLADARGDLGGGCVELLCNFGMYCLDSVLPVICVTKQTCAEEAAQGMALTDIHYDGSEVPFIVGQVLCRCDMR